MRDHVSASCGGAKVPARLKLGRAAPWEPTWGRFFGVSAQLSFGVSPGATGPGARVGEVHRERQRCWSQGAVGPGAAPGAGACGAARVVREGP